MFHWIPGTTASDEAISRMRAQFRKPHKPTGEAWFMSEERKMYDDLMSKNLSELPCEYFQDVLFEIISGKKCFPEIVDSEGNWKSWHQYLLPELILRAHERYAHYLLEDIITAFIVYFEQCPDAEYQGFRYDAVSSLGIALMNPKYWQIHPNSPHEPAKRIPLFLVKDFEEVANKLVGGRDVEGAFSSAMFFCLKYLEPSDMRSWVDSIVLIEDSHWRAAVLNWILGAQNLLTDGSYWAFKKAAPAIQWLNSFQLENGQEPLIPIDNTSAFREQIKRRFTTELLGEWEKQLKNAEQFFVEPRDNDNQTASLDWLFSQMPAVVKA